MSRDPMVPLAARRAQVHLRDGRSVVLVGVHGNRARVELPSGQRVTVLRERIVLPEAVPS